MTVWKCPSETDMRDDITRRRFGSIVAATAAGAPAVMRRAMAQGSSTRELEQTKDHDVGVVLRCAKPYFPMLLGNGREHVLIGYSGSMGACAGHEHWSYGTTYTGWFRPDTRTRPARGVLNLLLLRGRDDSIELFAGLPPAWGDASFRSLRAPVGLLVTAARTRGKISAELTNDSDRPHSPHRRACGPEPWEETVSLKPNEKITFP